MKPLFLPESRGSNAQGGMALGMFALLMAAASGPVFAAEDWSGSHGPGAYAGIFVGSAQADNRLIDTDGFANWGNPGSVTRYKDSGFIGGVLIGKKFTFGDASIRLELDGTIGDLEARPTSSIPRASTRRPWRSFNGSPRPVSGLKNRLAL